MIRDTLRRASAAAKTYCGKGLCLIGIHRGDWAYEAPGRCSQKRTCVRCRKIHARTEHAHGDWVYVSEGSCDSVNTCTRCGQQESRVDHRWGDFEYESPDTCTKVRECARCRERDVSLFKYHDLGDWEFEVPGACVQIRKCRRCHETGESREAHQREPRPGGALVCRNCGDTLLPVVSQPCQHQRERRSAVEVFADDDEGYLRWIAAHPSGYVLNYRRPPEPNNLKLHNADCTDISGTWLGMDDSL